MELREMLELAALAFWGDEIDDVCSIRWLDAEGCIGYTHADNQDHNGNDVDLCWSPHTDDGDSRRLEVALNMDVLRDPASASQPYIEAIANQSALPADTPQPFAVEPYDTDPLAATRMAVLRCAAEMGKSMKEKSE